MSYIRDLISGWYVYGDPDGGLTIQFCGLEGRSYSPWHIADCVQCGSVDSIDHATAKDAELLLDAFRRFLANREE